MDNVIQLSGRMHCKKYHAEISESTCVARQKFTKLLEPRHERFAQYFTDPGCKKCDQGTSVIKMNKERRRL